MLQVAGAVVALRVDVVAAERVVVGLVAEAVGLADVAAFEVVRTVVVTA